MQDLKTQLLLWVKALKETGLDYFYLNTLVTDLDTLRDKVNLCTACELHKTRRNVVFGEGDPSSILMFVGEAPGAEEDLQGRPFVGASGQLLTKMIQAMGLQREGVYIANVIKCRPPSNRDPNRWEIASCFGYLKFQIEFIRPKLIVTLGRIAAKTLLGIPEREPFSEIRGRWHEYRGIPVMPTYHPSFLLRNPDKKREAWEDLKQVMKRMAKDDASP